MLWDLEGWVESQMESQGILKKNLAIGLLWDALGCFGMLWDAMGCSGILKDGWNPKAESQSILKENPVVSATSRQDYNRNT